MPRLGLEKGPWVCCKLLGLLSYFNQGLGLGLGVRVKISKHVLCISYVTQTAAYSKQFLCFFLHSNQSIYSNILYTWNNVVYDNKCFSDKKI